MLKLKEIKSYRSTPLAQIPKLMYQVYGTPRDCMRFWGKFEYKIGKSHLDDLTKLSYVKKFVDVKSRKLIHGLQFTTKQV